MTIHHEICRQCSRCRRIDSEYSVDTDDCPQGTVAVQYNRDINIKLPEDCIYRVEQTVMDKPKV